MDYYVYVHKKKTTGEVFYVGKGSGNRAWSAFGRNLLWEGTAEKYGWYVEIVEDNIQDWYAFELEKDLISFYGRRDLDDGVLTNLSDGGDGPSRLNPETRKKISEALSGPKHYKADKLNYSFYNFLSKDKFLGTRMDFESKYNLRINGLFSSKRMGISSHFGWVVLDHLPKDVDLEKLETKTMEGMNNPNADTDEYTFLHLPSGDTFKGTRVAAKRDLGINTNTLFYSGTTCRGWVILDGKTEEDLIRLSDPHKAGTDKRRDKTVYSFSHKDGSKFTGTREDFTELYGFQPYHLLSNSPSKTQKGWYLSKNEVTVKQSRRCKVVYNWLHDTYGNFSGTREQLERIYSVDTRPLFITGTSRKSVKGWSLCPEKPE